MDKAVEAIRNAGVVTYAVRHTYFQGQGFGAIRNWLQENGLDRHLAIELRSTEIALVTPFGIMMQIRPTDHDQLGLWGGVLKDTETPEDGAIRELREETGIEFPADALEFMEENDHSHQYANGDKAIFHCYRFKIVLDYVPKIKTDEESTGVFMLVHTVLDHQQDFVKRILGEK